jgi:hypothetical protein
MTLKNVTVSAETGVTIYNATDIRFAGSRIDVARGPKLTTYQAQVEGLDATNANGNDESH